MPMYEYKCTKCGNLFNKLIWSPSDEKDLKCPRCDAKKPERQVSQVGGTSGSGCSTEAPRTPYVRRYG